MDSFMWNIVLHIKPFSTQNDIVKCEFVNKWDIFVQFKNGEKYIYDTYSNTSRYIPYTIDTITDEEWRIEFKIKLNDLIKRGNYNQTDLALYLNTTQQTISKYCTGKIMPNIYTLHRMGLFFNIPYQELLFIDYSV